MKFMILFPPGASLLGNHLEAITLKLGKCPGITPYKHLGKISDNLHSNNQNNRLERRAQPPRDVPLDTQLWTRVFSLSSRVVITKS